MPLGLSLILVYGTRILSRWLSLPKEVIFYIFSILIAVSIIGTIQGYWDYIRDWYKQQALILHFREINEIKNNSTFLVEDNTMDLNARKRYYRHYEYSGLMRSAFSDEKRIAIDVKQYYLYYKNKNEFYKVFKENAKLNYNISDYEVTLPQRKIIINPGDRNVLSFINRLNLIFKNIFSKYKFHGEVKKLVNVSVEEINND